MDPQIDPRRAVATRQDSMLETILETLIEIIYGSGYTTNIPEGMVFRK
jgi:hypothetical protein